uniref:Novel plant SNARE 11-like n=1 Tax=Nicotiana tabacum TaxID=4097 RepID=A0A1S3XG66_TOBAC|nr:PREDICTED: novel plant SNARE 11-like [Nicotiana tabacum]
MSSNSSSACETAEMSNDLCFFDSFASLLCRLHALFFSQVVHETVNVGTETAAALKAQTEQMSRIVNELDSIHFSIKKATQLVKELGRQVATDRCIMGLLFLIVVGVITIIIVKIVNPHNKDIRDIPGLAPPAPSRRLLAYPY